MDGLSLASVSTTRQRKDALSPKGSPSSKDIQSLPVASAEEALEVIRGEPGYDALIGALRFLGHHTTQDAGPFSIATPSPIGSRIIQALVTSIASNYWVLLKEDAQDLAQKERRKSGASLFLQCLRNIPGVNAVLLQLRTLILEAKQESKEVKRPDITSNLLIVLEILSALLDSHESARLIWTSTSAAAAGETNPSARKPLSREYLSLLGSGRIISWAAEAEEILNKDNRAGRNRSFWVADGAQYSAWLVQTICTWVSRDVAEDDVELCSELLAKACRLGHTDSQVKIIIERLLLSRNQDFRPIRLLFDNFPNLEQRKFLFAVLHVISEVYLNKLGACNSPEDTSVVSGASAAIDALVGKDERKIGHLVAWLVDPSGGAGLGEGVGIRRAVLPVVTSNRESLVGVLEKSISQFADQLYIKHSPALQQEAHAQVLLLSAGYVHRLAPTKLSMMTRSSTWLNTVSNRLSASQPRARFLGMVVGEAISGLVDKGQKRLDFHIEETSLDEGQWYKSLVEVSDRVGNVGQLRRGPNDEQGQKEAKRPARPLPKRQLPAEQPRQQGFVIEEVEDETDDDDDDKDDDLIAYAKPGSDDEDSDDDPTLVRRDKPKAPVYVRDLIRYLRDSDDYDHQNLGILTAPALIRRKANFGTEVKEHAEELASLLVGLQDKFEIDNFYDLRIQGMVALIVAQPASMGQWFARTFFDGDYSVSQRASVLVVLGIGARELAGFETSQHAKAASFPSKSLPEAVERLYIGEAPSSGQLPSTSSLKPLPPNALEEATQSLTTKFLAPIAASAADAAAGPDSLKLSTFTSRLKQAGSPGPSGEKKTPQARLRVIPNTTAQLIYTSIFSPLTARFQAALRSPASRGRGIIFEPYLLSLYLKTLAIALHAAGPSTLALPQMTAELWGLLLNSSIRAHSVGDIAVIHSVLFALLAILDVNEDRMRDVCQGLSREVVETQEWIAAVFEGTRGGDRGEENDVKMLSAAVLIRLREAIEKYQALLMGDLIGSY